MKMTDDWKTMIAARLMDYSRIIQNVAKACKRLNRPDDSPELKARRREFEMDQEFITGYCRCLADVLGKKNEMHFRHAFDEAKDKKLDESTLEEYAEFIFSDLWD